jgi:hypothetical protein
MISVKTVVSNIELPPNKGYVNFEDLDVYLFNFF